MLSGIDKCQVVSSSGKRRMHFTNTEKEGSVVCRPIVLLPSTFNKLLIFYLKMKHKVILSGHFIPVSDGFQLHHLSSCYGAFACSWGIMEEPLLITLYLSSFFR